MLGSLNSVVVIFTMIGIGFILTKKNLLNDDTNHLFSKLVINMSLPLMMIVSLTERFTKEDLMGSGWWILLSFLVVIISYFLSILIARCLNEEKSTIFTPMIAFSNTIFIGLPVNMEMFGEKALPYVFLFYISNTVLFWTLGVSKISGKGGFDNILVAIKKIINPPLMGFIGGVFLIITGIEIYSPIISVFKYIGGITTPLSLFFIGTVLAKIDPKGVKIGKREVTMLLGKFFMTPLVALGVLTIFGKFLEVPTLLKHVYIIQASMPAMTNVAIVSKYYDRDYRYASLMVGISTVLCILTIPFYTFIISYIG